VVGEMIMKFVSLALEGSKVRSVSELRASVVAADWEL
jgi:hypothetical protein